MAPRKDGREEQRDNDPTCSLCSDPAPMPPGTLVVSRGMIIGAVCGPCTHRTLSTAVRTVRSGRLLGRN